MNTFKKVWKIVSTTLVILIVLCAVFLMGTRLLGYECYTVISGSMKPTYDVGDLLYVKETNPTDVKVGEPITFVLNEQLDVATHRVVAIDAENQHFYTKGDANRIADEIPVHFNNLIGVPQFSIPKLGYVSDFVQNPPGMYIVIGVGILLIILVFLPDMFGKKKKDEEAAQIAAVETDIAAANEENEQLKAELEKLRADLAANKTESSDEK